jgi:hypothetical protein
MNLFPQKLFNVSFTNPTSTVGLELLNLLSTESNAQMNKWWHHDCETWHKTTGYVWYDQMSCPSCRSLHQEEFTFGEHPRKPAITRGRFCDGFGSNTWCSTLLVPLLPFMAKLLQGSTCTGWVIRCNPWSRRYFRKMHFFKTTVPPWHSRTLQSWFEEHEGELQHIPWPAQSADLNIIEPFWSVLETRVRNRFPIPKSLKQLEDV